jgi:hypothetical protein
LSRGASIFSPCGHAGIGAGRNLSSKVNPARGTPLRNRPAQEHGVLPAHPAQKYLPQMRASIELLAYSAAHIALIENDILFMC